MENYRDNDTTRYDANIAIFDTMRYIVPTLAQCGLKTDLDPVRTKVSVSIQKIITLTANDRRTAHSIPATGKMRTCGSVDFGMGSGENNGLRLRLGFV